MVYLVYILQSLVDQSYYIGYQGNLEKRIAQHNCAKTGYSSRKKPWKLVYTEAFNLKTEAIKRERFIKNQKSQDFILRLISTGNIPNQHKNA